MSRGLNTRWARSTRTVRAAMAASALVAGPAWGAALETPNAWRANLSLPLGWSGAGPLISGLLICSGIAAGLIAWRQGPLPLKGRNGRIPPAFGSALLTAIVAAYAIAAHDTQVAAAVLVVVPVVGGWFVGQAARVAASATVPAARNAAGRAVLSTAVLGLEIAAHLALVGRGRGVVHAEAWGLTYLALAAINLARAHRFRGADAARAAALHQPAGPAVTGAALGIDDVHVSFGANHVLRGATLIARSGEMLALVGANGSGKSTLLRVGAGLVPIPSGRVVAGGRDITPLLAEERAARGVVLVSGARPVLPDLTVLENLRVAAAQTHPSRAAFDAATEAILQIIPALRGRAHEHAGVLSGGEQRLLAVAQTLYRAPSVVLADEVTLGLDREARIAVLDLLRLLASQGAAVVVVDHDLPALLPRAHRAALIAEGTVTLYRDPAGLLARRRDLLPAAFLAGAGAGEAGQSGAR